MGARLTLLRPVQWLLLSDNPKKYLCVAIQPQKVLCVSIYQTIYQFSYL